MRFFRIYFSVAGGHTHTRWFSGATPRGVLGKRGELSLPSDEWEALCDLLRHPTVQFIEDKRDDE
jgi:hypothetical protein